MTETKEVKVIPIRRHDEIPLEIGGGIFGLTLITGLVVGGTITTYLFFGVLTLGSIVAIAESNERIKRLIHKSSRTIDVVIFVGTLAATATLGVTVTAAWTVAGLGYSLVYAPYVRKTYTTNQN